jgi:hypothetical protein
LMKGQVRFSQKSFFKIMIFFKWNLARMGLDFWKMVLLLTYQTLLNFNHF